ncbi:carbohydrate kinase family protein [Variovorax sp. PCZ-1]|uniref:carbohydrate kinase family protein n=1 Tax=Variovorax sp. PCZ-1 TaxID=2835533 RepID=UPI001BCA79B4|nr:carbohydrate kinase family protein [Variovorax sp. PCZ-1]MBS7806758.1 carbohydrate kinase family protein [Variovorax sp. PCZ-1]
MKTSLAPQPTLDVLCIGGINLDRKLKALQPLSSQSSNPCVASESPGGVARNVAENLARLGLQVSLLGHVGRDAAAQAVLMPLRELGVDTGSCRVSDAGSTGSYTAVLDANGQLVMGMADMALTELLTPELLETAITTQNAKLWMTDMNLPASSLAWLTQQAHAREQRLVMLAVSEPKMNRLPSDLHGVNTLVLNGGELAALGLPQDDIHAAFAKLRALGLQRLVVTFGEQGVQCIEAEQTEALHIKPELPEHLKVVDVSGAGDAFCAGLCASYLRYPADSLASQVKRAMKLSVLTVQSTSTVSTAITPDLI